jgi:hypothetical protein
MLVGGDVEQSERAASGPQRPAPERAATSIPSERPVLGQPQRPSPDRPNGDQRPRLSLWAAERRNRVQPEEGGREDPSQMERQVRDQLYGPEFRRR